MMALKTTVKMSILTMLLCCSCLFLPDNFCYTLLCFPRIAEERFVRKRESRREKREGKARQSKARFEKIVIWKIFATYQKLHFL